VVVATTGQVNALSILQRLLEGSPPDSVAVL